jgi:hypothetical protein
MRPHHWFFLSLLTLPATAAPLASVRFANNDALIGTAESITPGALVWNSPLLEKPASFHLDKVLELTLPASEPEQQAPDHEATITLTNGDTLRGQLASVTDEIVALDTWFAGRLEFRRVMVSGVKIEERAGFLYRGPTGIDGWIQAEESPPWSYSRSAFRSSATGGIARADLLTDECSISFDAAWKGDSIRMRVILFSDDASTDNPSSGYELSFQRGSIHLRNCKTQSFLGSTQSQALMENDKVRVEIRASMKNNRIALFINDRITEVWNDPDGQKNGKGSALHFISGSQLPLRISNIRIAPWDGAIERMPEPQFGMRAFGMQGVRERATPAPAPEDKGGERMELANGDSMTGEVLSIQDGVIAIKSPLGEIDLPVSRLRTLALKPVEAERSIRRNGDVRAWFPDGSSIVFRLDDCGDGTLVGSSQNFGTATFQIAAFNRIEFNIYSSEHQALRGTDDW